MLFLQRFLGGVMSKNTNADASQGSFLKWLRKLYNLQDVALRGFYVRVRVSKVSAILPALKWRK